MRMLVTMATRRADVLRCQYLIAESYNRHYDIYFSKDVVNLNDRIEPYPDRYAMGIIDGEVVATAGLNLGRTYVETYGGVSEEDIRRVLTSANATGYSARLKREYTKLVISEAWERKRLGRRFLEATHCRQFLQIDAKAPHVIICCAKVSIFRSLYDRSAIRTRVLKSFPEYAVHSNYRTPEDPMESRLIIPDLDIPAEIYDRSLPIEIEIAPEEQAP